MSARNSALGEYLRARRDALQPVQVGLPASERRRVAGLRREEVAELAGISPVYYLRLEQGRGHQPSGQVLGALARALRLTAHEAEYLFRLARPHPRSERPAGELRTIGSTITTLLDHWLATPAVVLDANLDIVASNPPAREIGSGQLDPGRNLVETVLAAGSRTDDDDWADLVAGMVAALRFTGDPDDPRCQEIVDLLGARYPGFRREWGRHEARPLASGRVHASLAGVGPVRFDYQNLAIPGTEFSVLTMVTEQPVQGAPPRRVDAAA